MPRLREMFRFQANILGSDPVQDERELSEFIQPTDQASAAVRPDAIDEFYLEREYDAAAQEQQHAYAEQAEREAAPAEETAAGLEHAAESAITLSDQATEQASRAWTAYHTAKEALRGHVRRPTDAKLMKYLRWGLLLGGDVAGVSGAALLLGEQLTNAFLQALSAGAAAVTLGAVGRELRYLINARARQKNPKDLSDEERPYAHLFTGPHQGEALVKIITSAALAGIVIIAAGIFALRASTEGPMAAVTFACIALAVGLASLINAFDVADDIAEMLDNLYSQAKKAAKRAKYARRAPEISQRDAARAQARSKRAANTAAGQAAAAQINSRKYQALGQSPGVAGHGTPPRTADHNPAAHNGHHHNQIPQPTNQKPTP